MFSELLICSSHIWDLMRQQLIGMSSTCTDLILKGFISRMSMWVRLCVPSDYAWTKPPFRPRSGGQGRPWCHARAQMSFMVTIFPNPPPRTVCLIHKCLQVNLVCSSALHRLFKLLHWSGLRCCKTDFDTTRTGCSALLTSSECSIVNLSPLTMMNMSMRTSNFWCYRVQLLGVLCNCADLYGNVQARSGMYVLHMVQ